MLHVYMLHERGENMELKDYLSIISKKWWLLLISIIVIMLGVYYFSISAPKIYDASISLEINKKSEATKTTDYQYDRYYAIEASSLMTDSVISWIKDPDLISQVYSKANQDLTAKNIKSMAKIFNPKKELPSTIVVSTSSDSENKAISLLRALKTTVLEKSQIGEAQNFEIKTSEPISVLRKINLTTNLVLGLVSGLILGLILIFVSEYFKPIKK